MLAVLATSSCASTNDETKGNNKVSQERTEIRDFNAITIAGSPDVYYTQGKGFSVKVVAPEKIINHVITEVENHRLNISIERSVSFIGKGGTNISFGGDNNVKVYVTSPDIVAVTVNGSGFFSSEKKIDTDKMALRLNGSGDIIISDIVCDDISAELAGSGDVEVNNVNAMTAKWRVYGSGDMEVKQRDVVTTEVNLSGSGDVSVNCVNCGTVTSSLQGSGDIMLSGRVGALQKKKAGSGDIHTDGLTVAKGK